MITFDMFIFNRLIRICLLSVEQMSVTFETVRINQSVFSRFTFVKCNRSILRNSLDAIDKENQRQHTKNAHSSAQNLKTPPSIIFIKIKK